MGRTIEANIECPFYVKIQGCKLVCEGLPDGCLRTSHTFADGKVLSKWLKENCCQNFGRGCKHHRALMTKYYDEKKVITRGADGKICKETTI